MELETILKAVTVDCKDNGTYFTVKDRIQAIDRLLKNTEYQLLHEGNLCYIYGKQPVENQPVLLISSHIDCVYKSLFCQDNNNKQMWEGTFDNSLTNACVLYDMLQGILDKNVIVAFTGDEEYYVDGVGCRGATEVVRTLQKWSTRLALAIVLDVTESGYNEQHHFTIENDRGIDNQILYRIGEQLKQYYGVYSYIHDSEPDETYKYCIEKTPCFSLCIPTCGDMHDEKGVLVRANALPTYCSALSELANMLSEFLF